MSNVYVYDITITDIYLEEDWGTISSSASVSEDYQSITTSPTSSEDWYSINNNQTQIPFGSIGNISGSSVVIKTNAYDASGVITASNIVTENVTFVWVGNGTLFEIGNGLERTLRPYVSSGTLRTPTITFDRDSYTFDQEDVTFDNSNAGIVSAIVTFSVGSLSDTQLFNISSVSLESETDAYVGLGTIILSQELVHPNIDYTPSYTGTGVINISGSTITKDSYSYVSSGTLFGFGEKLESRTYNYDETDIFEFSSDNYGFVSESASEFDNYGSVIIPANESFDFGVVTGFGATDTLYPFGSATLSGTGIESFSANTPENTQLFVISGRARLPLSARYIGIGTLTLSGSLVEKDVDSYVGLGTLTFSGTALEAYSAQTPENTQLFSFSSGYSDLKFIAQTPENTQLFSFSSGYSDLKFIAQTPENTQLFTISGGLVEKNTESYVGFGTHLFDVGIFSIPLTNDTNKVTFDSNYIYFGDNELRYDGIVSFSAQTPENTQLFSFSGIGSTREIQVYGINPGVHLYPEPPDFSSGLITISGELVHPNIDYTPHYGIEKNIGIGTTGIQLSGFASNLKEINSYVGIGTLFEIGEKFESRTYVYDEYDFIEFNNFDYGLISSSLDSPSEDYGDFSYTPSNDDFGFIVDPLTGLAISSSLYPFGSIYILGSAAESFNITPYNASGLIVISGFSSDREIQVYGKDYITTGTLTLSGSLIEKNTESYVGLGTLTFSGTALEAYSAQTPENTQLFSFSSGYSNLKFIAQTPENTQLFTISGSLIEKDVDSYVGIGTLTLSGSLIEKNTESYVGLGTLTFSGTALEAYSAQTPENTQLFSFSSGYSNLKFIEQADESTQLFTISGSLIEKDVDSYVGTGTLAFSQSLIEKDVDSYVGVGTLTFFGNATYNLNQKYVTPVPATAITLSGELVHPNIDFTPHYGIEKNIGIGTTGIQFLRGVGYTPDSEGNPRDARTYSNRYPINDKVPGTGVGTIFFDQTRDIAKYSPLTPYTGTGLFKINTGFSPKVVYPYAPLGIGKSWSYTRTTYIASGDVSISGIASTREIAVYGYYGNDFDPGTSGQITISQETQPIIIKETDSYVGLGTYTLSGISSTPRRRSYDGSGSLTLFGTALEAYSAQTPENTQLFSFSGQALEVYSAQTPETEVLYIINGSLAERKTNSYVASGTVSVSGTATTRRVPNYPARGLFRFVSHTTDNVYDTCDSEEFTCDNQDSANVSFVANPVETTILYTFNGSANTEEIAVYSHNSSGSFTLYGGVQNIKLTHSESGIGTIFVASTSLKKEVDVYIGSGTLFGISGGSQSYSAQTPESTILISISGSATTRIESEYTVVGIGLITLSGSTDTRKITSYTQVGLGTIILSGELLYPNIIFIPSPDGSGTINIIGFSNNSLTKRYDQTTGSLFGFSSGFESFTKSTYIGIGTIYIQEVSGTTIDNPFQIPRTYVCII